MTDALRGGVVSLIRDLNGNHVIQRCLQRLGPEDSQFVYDAAAAHTMDIATHRHGCCVLQRCIDFATPPQKRRLVDQIISHALPLSQVWVWHRAWLPLHRFSCWALYFQCMDFPAKVFFHTPKQQMRCIGNRGPVR